ncbi:protein TonB [Granulicella aggregans]|uniref:Protein TonB n=1 Tax=Granulicella aggregans TaxID=474949 RepID=A0A7W7ZCW9_9BACT|nr:energy transducer TonB [Granulicella aggregans]MBB5057518.1 protein TonB [Granulicella aggregans]
MANSLMIPPEIEPSEEVVVVPRKDVELHLDGKDLLGPEQGIFASLKNSLYDVFFPKKLPPLVLESRPVAVVDRMAVKRDPTSTAIAVVIHAVIIGLILWVVGRKIVEITAPPKANIVSLETPVPPPAPVKTLRMGGGGGQKGPAPVSKGTPPKFSPQQILPPMAPPKIDPKLAVAPTIDVDPKLKMASNMPNIGMPNATNVGVSMGNGNGNGLGSGNGNGMGPGSGGNTGGGIRQIGGSVSAPKLVSQVDPEFSEEARKAKYMGVAIVDAVIDEHGIPVRVRIISDPGMGLGERAVEAVKQWRFKPGTENGKAVKTELQIQVDFHIY